jgi:hypothetical protein
VNGPGISYLLISLGDRAVSYGSSRGYSAGSLSTEKLLLPSASDKTNSA